jgi:8-oxo-dGTP diphosphatase
MGPASDRESGVPTTRYGVVIACQRDDGRWLMVRRAAGVERAPLKVGFPGGEVEPGETQEHAVVREAFEELGILVRPMRRVWEHRFPDGRWILHGWLAQWTGGELVPNPHEVAEVLWLTAEEGAAHPEALPTMKSLCDSLEPRPS